MTFGMRRSEEVIINNYRKRLINGTYDIFRELHINLKYFYEYEYNIYNAQIP